MNPTVLENRAMGDDPAGMRPRTAASRQAPIRLLCVEDNPDDVELMGLALERADPSRRYELHRVDDASAFVEALADDWDAILCDFNMPRFSPYAALQILVARKLTTPLVVVTRAIGEDAAVHVLRCGAKDYVTKDKLGTLPQIVERVMADRERALEKERLGRELEAAYRRLKNLSARLVVAQERERNLISRELHDQLGQTLTGMVIHLHAARRTSDPESARKHTETAMDMAQGAVGQLKTLSFSLRPAQLDLLGLVAAARSAVQRIAEPAGLAFAVTARGAEPPELGETASVALRIIQEAITNVARHAQASRVLVRIHFLPHGRIGVLVVDDGVGFDKDALLDGQPSEKNVGLYGMIERTELAGGRLSIRTAPGCGVVVRAVL
jgi:signal transduction histidine kinase